MHKNIRFVPTYLVYGEVCKGRLATNAAVGVLLSHQVQVSVIANDPVANRNLIVPRRARLLDVTGSAATEWLEEVSGTTIFGPGELDVCLRIVAV